MLDDTPEGRSAHWEGEVASLCDTAAAHLLPLLHPDAERNAAVTVHVHWRSHLMRPGSRALRRELRRALAQRAVPSGLELVAVRVRRTSRPPGGTWGGLGSCVTAPLCCWMATAACCCLPWLARWCPCAVWREILGDPFIVTLRLRRRWQQGET